MLCHTQLCVLYLARLKALVRDNFCCMVTGMVDAASLEEGLVVGPEPDWTTSTECAHIFPESLGHFDGDTEKEVRSLPLLFYFTHLH